MKLTDNGPCDTHHDGDRLSAALALAAEGRWVIPIDPASKTPMVSWKRHQFQRASEYQIRCWWARWPDANVGVVTGAISDIVVVDLDPRNGADLDAWREQLPPTRTALSGRGDGGCHLWYSHPGDRRVASTKPAPGVDLQGEGAYVVVPPSVHPETGGYYTWVQDGVYVAPLPPELLPHEPGFIPDRPSAVRPVFAELWRDLRIVLRDGDHDYKCPFHPHDDHSSLSIDTVTEVFICHACGTKGGIAKLWSLVRPNRDHPGDLSEQTEQVVSAWRRVATPGLPSAAVRGIEVVLALVLSIGSLVFSFSRRQLAKALGCTTKPAGQIFEWFEAIGLLRLVERGEGTRQRAGGGSSDHRTTRKKSPLSRQLQTPLLKGVWGYSAQTV